MVHIQHTIYNKVIAPLGALVWQTFKNRCPSVRTSVRTSVRPDFWQIMQGVQQALHDFWVHILRQNFKKWKVENPKCDLIPCNRDHIKFFWRKNKKRFAKYIWPKNQKFSQLGPYTQCKNKNVIFCRWKKSWSTSDWRQTSSTQESLKGPPLPCGCNLV